ncbi:reverse transcriptase domain-containing protein [Tanacetum coccineum]
MDILKMEMEMEIPSVKASANSDVMYSSQVHKMAIITDECKSSVWVDDLSSSRSLSRQVIQESTPCYDIGYTTQDHINTVELPMYERKIEKFDRPIAIKSCSVNNEKFDPANWWKSYGGSAPNLRTIAIRILTLTTSSSGCERIWSIFEGVHTKKRNRLEVAKMNNLVYVQANANLMEHNKKRKARNHEILLGENASEAQEWIVEFDNAHWEAVGDALGVEDELRPRTSARNKERELFEDDFVSGSEEEVDEVEYESDGAQIIEQYGQDKN